MNIAPLKWDSDFFNLKIGKISNVEFAVIPALEEVRLYDLIYIEETEKTNSNNSLEQIKFTDKKIIYSKILKDIPVLSSEISEYTSTEINDKLLDLAIQSGAFSRFKLDIKFEANAYKKLYKQWIINSVTKQSADMVLVYGDSKNPKGFITLVFKPTFAQIGLIAVDANEQHQGIGKALINAAAAYASQNNFTNLQVITQAINKDACLFYERCGFNKENEIHTHHYWNK